MITDNVEFMDGGDHYGCRVQALTAEGPWECMGMHCAFCGKPCGAQGHWICFQKSRR